MYHGGLFGDIIETKTAQEIERERVEQEIEMKRRENERQLSIDRGDGLYLTRQDKDSERKGRIEINNNYKLNILYLLILKYLSETPPYSQRDASGIITEVNIEAIQKLLTDREQLKKEILGYISLDNKFTKSQIKKFNIRERWPGDTSAKMIDGSYDKYNSIFYIQLTAGGNFIIYYLNAEKYCVNVNSSVFFIKHAEFRDQMKEVLDTITENQILGIKSFQPYILFNKLDKIEKGTNRKGDCFVQLKEPEYGNMGMVYKEIKKENTTVGGRKSKKRKTYKRKTYKRKKNRT